MVGTPLSDFSEKCRSFRRARQLTSCWHCRLLRESHAETGLSENLRALCIGSHWFHGSPDQVLLGEEHKLCKGSLLVLLTPSPSDLLRSGRKFSLGMYNV